MYSKPRVIFNCLVEWLNSERGLQMNFLVKQMRNIMIWSFNLFKFKKYKLAAALHDKFSQSEVQG